MVQFNLVHLKMQKMKTKKKSSSLIQTQENYF